MPTLAQAITDMIQKALPQPNIKIGTVTAVIVPGVDELGAPVRGRIMVGGLAGPDVSVPCDWSANFDLELSAMAEDLVGYQVEVHFADGQPLIAYSIVLGGK